ncbi:MAG: tRNA epoxyqueuosine(34) reductase QueG [Gammaproteobacteria bacterium]|nr:tRNA epoxyqueuosine(34) reductase QueG [Gammaproteobacteria bacterium]
MQAMDITLPEQIKQLGYEFGFQQVGITDTRLDQQHQHYQQWAAENYHGEMSYMVRNIDKRLNPPLLVPDTLSVICVSLEYLHDEGNWPITLLKQSSNAYVARYALGRDYHKLMRKRLKRFAEKITALVGEMGYRVFTDSAPVMEKALAAKAGIGWQGKHSNILNRDGGSWFFLGEIYTDVKLATDQPVVNHCGRCTACIDVCPTQAIVAPYVIDARRCISYLTIEHRSAIPVEMRPAIGNRIYGCDDCQLFCPWNRFANKSKVEDFKPRHGLDKISLLDCFSWSEHRFDQNTLGSAIRRIGYQRWLRNIVVALGNADYDPHTIEYLRQDYDSRSDMLREHIDWAIAQQQGKLA